MAKRKLNKNSSLEVMVVDHCNLNCRSCDHCSPILKPWLYDIEAFKKDLAILKKNFRPLKLIKFLGGEPFLNKNLLEFLSFTRKMYPRAHIKILTNGTLLPKDSDPFWEISNKLRIEILISWYLPLGLNKFEKYSRLNKRLDFFRVTTFFEGILFKNPLEKSSYKICKLKDNCTTLRDGIIYKCSEGYSCKKLSDFFNLDYPLGNMSIDIRKQFNGNLYKNFRKKEAEQCKYCTYQFRDIIRKDWNQSEKKPEEWVLDNEIINQ